MPSILSTRLGLGLLAGAGLLLSSSSGEAAIIYHVQVNTTSLSQATAPLALDFQLNDGNTNSNITNSVTISNFTFGGGAATNNPAATGSGLTSGNLGSTITLTDNAASPFNEFYQGFTPGSTLGFDVSLSTNVNPLTPDAFAFAILDNNLANFQTTDPSGADTLMRVDITSASPTVQFSSGTGQFATLTAVPEPATGFFGCALVGMVGMVRRRTSGK